MSKISILIGEVFRQTNTINVIVKRYTEDRVTQFAFDVKLGDWEQRYDGTFDQFMKSSIINHLLESADPQNHPSENLLPLISRALEYRGVDITSAGRGDDDPAHKSKEIMYFQIERIRRSLLEPSGTVAQGFVVRTLRGGAVSNEHFVVFQSPTTDAYKNMEFSMSVHKVKDFYEKFHKREKDGERFTIGWFGEMWVSPSVRDLARLMKD